MRPWHKPWSAEHAAGSIVRPLRATGQPYRGVNVLLLWGEAEDKAYAAPIWITYRWAATLGAQVRKGEHRSLVVYADRITKTFAECRQCVEKRPLKAMRPSPNHPPPALQARSGAISA